MGDKNIPKGTYSVDGYYLIEGNVSVRQIRNYDVESFEDAEKKAKEDGLIQGTLMECCFEESHPCNLHKDTITLSKLNKLINNYSSNK